MITERLLGLCRICQTSLTYNIHAIPYCDSCDCVEMASRCYHCGAEVWPQYDQEPGDLFCPACNGYRLDFFFHEMGSGNSARFKARLGRAVGLVWMYLSWWTWRRWWVRWQHWRASKRPPLELF